MEKIKMSGIHNLLFSKVIFFLFLLFQGVTIQAGTGGTADSKKEALQFYSTGNNYYTAEKYEEAMMEYDNAVNLDKDYFYLMSERGIFEEILKMKQKNLSESVKKICLELIENQNESVDYYVFYYLGWAELNLQNKDQAQLHLKNAIQLMKKDEIPSADAEVLLNQAST